MSDQKTQDPLANVREGYDRWAAIYDHDKNPLSALEQPYVQAEAGEVHGLEALDLGCGTGRHAAWLAAAGAQVTAIDFSAGMLAEARRSLPEGNVTFLTHDLHQPLPFAPSAFDLVVSGLVLEHVRDIPTLFSQVHQVLRPGGRAVLSSFHPAMFLRESQARFTDPDSGVVIAPGSLPHSMSEFVMGAVQTGFTLKHIGEYSPDADFAASYPRCEKYIGYPMLVLLSLVKPAE